MWEEGLRVALRCLTETPFTGHVGKYVTMPRAEVDRAGLDAFHRYLDKIAGESVQGDLSAIDAIRNG